MTPKLVPQNTSTWTTLQRLRPPSAKKLYQVVPFNSEGLNNPGNVYRLVVDESAVAAGTGFVRSVRTVFAAWAFTPGTPNASSSSYEIVIDHGNSVQTVVHGLLTTEVSVGQKVARGDKLGELLGSELFFQVLYFNDPYDPVTINRHFGVQDGTKVVGRTGYVKQAPDTLTRNFIGDLVSVIIGGIRFFVNILCDKPPYLINIAFNGNGSKTGQAAIGFDTNDYWNAVLPVNFETTSSYRCGPISYTYSPDPIFFLLDYALVTTPVTFERVVQANNGGTSARFDPMLSRWIGGYSGPTPHENTFLLKYVPSGMYVLYLYANEGSPPNTSNFYVSVGAGAPSLKTNTPTVVTAFVEDGNYVRYELDIPANGYVTIQVFGYLAGLQLQRT